MVGTYGIRRVFGAHTGAIEQKPNGGHLLPLAFAERIHELFELRRPLDLEEDLVVVVGHFDIKVLHGRRLAGRGGVEIAFGSHICGRVRDAFVVSICVEELVPGIAQGLSHSFAKGDRSKGNGGTGTYAFFNVRAADEQERWGKV